MFTVLTTPKNIVFEIELPYSLSTEKKIKLVFPVNSEDNDSLLHKLKKYDELFKKAQAIAKQNKQLKLTVDSQEKKIKLLENREGQNDISLDEILTI